MTKNLKNKPNEGPKTRAQLKKTEEINRKTNKDENGENGDDKKKTRETVKKKGWTSLQDVEAKLKALEKQYSNAKDDRNKKKVQELIGKYKKQAKSLLIKSVMEKKEANDTSIWKEPMNVIDEEDEVEDDQEENTVMSDITIKTVNSANKIVRNNTKKKSSRKSESTTTKSNEEKETINKDSEMKSKISNRTPSELNSVSEKNKNKDTNNIAKLESIGRTRKSPTKSKTSGIDTKVKEKEMNESRKNAIITQEEDNGTIMSTWTVDNKEEKKHNNSSSDKEGKMHTKETETSNGDETIMSEETKTNNTTNKSRYNGENTTKKKDSQEEKSNEKHNNGESNKEERLEDQACDGNTIMSEMTRDNQDSKEDNGKDTEDEKKEQLKGKEEKEKTKVSNPYTKETHTKTTKQSYANVVNNKNTEIVEVSEINEHGKIDTNKHQVRLKFNFIGRNVQGSKNMYKKQVLYEMIQCAKLIDPKVAVNTWEENNARGPINGDQSRLLNDKTVKEYVNFSPVEGEYCEGKVYYNNAIRLSTRMSLDEFIDRWNFERYKEPTKTLSNKWHTIKPAEMQNSAKAYPIGYMAGTTERGDYETVKKQLENEFQSKIEVSYQAIYQLGVSPGVWNLANKIAYNQYRNTNSKEYKRTKFSMAPMALVVYTGDQKHVKGLRSTFINKYGKIRNGIWPIMSDKSSMRFIPITQGYVKDDENRNKLFMHLKHQAASKAGEIKIPLKFGDIKEDKDYLQGESIEKIIHGWKSKKDDEIPVFKHITTRWSMKDEKIEHEVAVSSAMVEEATEVIKGLKIWLIKKYGNNVRSHFIDSTYKNDRT